jgi:hypothetical protein
MFKMMQYSNSTIDFSKYVCERTQNFTGREWVFQAINNWMADPEAPRFFLITGEPGSGKSAISGRLYQFSKGEVISPDGITHLKTHFLDAVHFCSSADERWINPRTFTESLAKQLAERYPIYRNALLEKSGDRKVSADIDVRMQNVTAGGDVTGVKIFVDLGSASATDGFNRIVREPLEELYRQNPTQQIIILVDALNEALSNKEKERTNIVDLITKSQYLPANVRFILTLRPETEMLRALRRNQPKPEEISLTSGSGLVHTGKDIREHVLVVLSTCQDLANKLAPDLPPNIFADTVQRKSEGNFLYVKYLIDMLKEEEKGEKITTESLNNFPYGLDEIYIEFLDRLIKSKGQAAEECLSVLGILTASQEALTEGQIANFVRTDKEKVRRLLTSLLQLLDTDESIPATQRTYSIYHRSFSEFLLDADRAEDYWCGEAYKYHQRIIEYYRTGAISWDKVDWSKVDDYGLLHLASHLYAIRDVKTDNSKYTYLEEFYSIICEAYMKEKLTRYGSFGPFASDLELVIQSAQSEKYRNLVQLVRGVLINATLQMTATEVPPQVLAALTLLGEDTRALGFIPLMGKQTRIEAEFLVGTALAQHEERGEKTQARGILLRVLDEYLEYQRSNGKGSLQVSIGRLSSSLAMIGELDQLLNQPEIISPTDKSSRDPKLEQITRGLASTGQIEEALGVSAKIEDKLCKAQALCSIAESFLRIGEKEKAKDMVFQAQQYAESIEDPMDKTYALKEVVMRLIENEEKERAILIIDQLNILSETISTNIGRANVLSVVVYLLACAQNNKKMLKVSEHVVGLLKGINDDDDKNEKAKKNAALHNLLYAMTLSGELKKGLITMELNRERDQSDELLVQISYALWGGWALGEIATKVALHLNEIGKIEEGLPFVEMIKDQVIKTEIIHDISESLFFEKKENLALNLSDRMHAIAETITYYKVHKDLAFSAAALTLAIAHEYSRAQEVANMVEPLVKMQKPTTDKDSIKSVIADIAKALADSGNADKALELVNKIEPLYVPRDIKIRIICGLAKTNQIAKVREFANEFLSNKEEFATSPPQLQIMALTLAGEVGQALEIVKDRKFVGMDRADVLSDMALALFVIGDKGESIKLANMALRVILMMSDEETSFEDKDSALKKHAVLGKVVQALATTNLFSEAIKLIDTIRDTGFKLLNYGYVASCLVAVGKELDARKIADKAQALILMNVPTSHEDNPTLTSQYPIDTLTMIVQNTASVIAISVGRSPLGADEVILATAASRVRKEKWLVQYAKEGEDNMLNQLMREGEFPSPSNGMKIPDGMKIKINHWTQLLFMVSTMIKTHSIGGDHERALAIWIRFLMWFHASDSSTISDRVLRDSKRSALFFILQINAPFIASIDQGQTLWKIYESIVEVESWWKT